MATAIQISRKGPAWGTKKELGSFCRKYFYTYRSKVKVPVPLSSKTTISSGGDPTNNLEMSKIAPNLSASRASGTNPTLKWTNISTRDRERRSKNSHSENNLWLRAKSSLTNKGEEAWDAKDLSTLKYNSETKRKIMNICSPGWDSPTSLTDRGWTSLPWVLTTNLKLSTSKSSPIEFFRDDQI